MTTPSRRRHLVLVIAATILLGACGSSSSGDRSVGAGGPASTSGPSTATTTTTPGGGEPASPVAKLTPADLRRVVAAAGAPLRSLHGPIAERVTITGRTVWRVRIPGSFPVRAARARIFVDGTLVGLAIAGPAVLVAVTTDPAALVQGGAVTYQWEGAPPVAAGRLEVVR